MGDGREQIADRELKAMADKARAVGSRRVAPARGSMRQHALQLFRRKRSLFLRFSRLLALRCRLLC